MKKINLFVLAGLLFIAPAIKAQTVSNEVVAKKYGKISAYGVLGGKNVGFIGNNEVMDMGKNSYKVFQGTKCVNENFLNGTIGAKDEVDFLFKPDGVLLARVDNSLEKAPIYIQAFDKNLKTSKAQKKVGELGVTLNASSTGSGVSINKRNVSIEIVQNEKSGNILLYCSVNTKGEGSKISPVFKSKSASASYFKLIVLDEELNVINTYDQEAKTVSDIITLTSPTITANNDVLGIASEIGDKQISSMQLVHFSKDGEAEHFDIESDKGSVLSTKISTNSVNDKVVVSILSASSEEDYKKCVLGVYNYNLTTKDFDRGAYGLDVENLNANSFHNFKTFNIDDITILEDGSVLFMLYGTADIYDSGVLLYNASYGMIFVKINKDGDFEWVTAIDKRDRGYHLVNDMNDYVRYFNEDGNLELIMNVHGVTFKEGSYKIPKMKYIDGTTAPVLNNMASGMVVKVVLDMTSGDYQVNKTNLLSKSITGLYLGEAQKLDEPGKYYLRFLKSKEQYNGIIDFRD